jgi:N-acylglucosamine-6-phosphate 2-epimerase
MVLPDPEHMDDVQATELAVRAAKFVAQVRGRLIVSCQALPGEPLHGPEFMARMALAAAQGGAAAIRANSPGDIRAIRQTVDLPIIGLFKEEIPGFPVYITPTLVHAQMVAHAGTDVVAIDATNRPRPEPGDVASFVASIRRSTGRPVLADVATVAEGIAAEAAGADFVSTTLSGYTADSPQQSGPDLALVAALAMRLHVPVLAEGRYRLPEQAAAALAAGALAVVVGGAITRPQEITRWFVAGITRAG